MNQVWRLVIPPLMMGDNLARAEFLRRWEAMPQLKKAELIGGIVYMPSPTSWEHGRADNIIGTWLGVFSTSSPGLESGTNATWLMLEDSPQPDQFLRILPEFGGKSGEQKGYPLGAPEFVAEVCVSSMSYDLHQKLQLYQKAGVDEYLAVVTYDQEIRWHRLVKGAYRLVPHPADGVWRSRNFPGLWLNETALFEGDMRRVLSTLAKGKRSPEHKAFVAQLAARRKT
jgi:Uma2 family endonuclease